MRYKKLNKLCYHVSVSLFYQGVDYFPPEGIVSDLVR